jgi:hypothetical protein
MGVVNREALMFESLDEIEDPSPVGGGHHTGARIDE